MFKIIFFGELSVLDDFIGFDGENDGEVVSASFLINNVYVFDALEEGIIFVSDSILDDTQVL